MCKTGAPRRKVVTPWSFFAIWVKRHIAGDGWQGRKENKRKKEVNWQGELNALDDKESRRKG